MFQVLNLFPIQFPFLHVKFNYILNFAFINPFLLTLSLIFKRGFSNKFSEEREFEMLIFFIILRNLREKQGGICDNSNQLRPFSG